MLWSRSPKRRRAPRRATQLTRRRGTAGSPQAGAEAWLRSDGRVGAGSYAGGGPGSDADLPAGEWRLGG